MGLLAKASIFRSFASGIPQSLKTGSIGMTLKISISFRMRAARSDIQNGYVIPNERSEEESLN